MTIGLIIIGDEIMSGKRSDRHFATLIDILKLRGLQLDWAKYLKDDPVRITILLKQSFASRDIVFSCGGIGSTPDDHTRQCVADALGVPLVLHPDARDKIYERIVEMAKEGSRPIDLDTPDNIQRMKMGEFPEGAGIIPNPVNKIPGFSVGTHYFLPGFPEMAHPMMEWVLDNYHKAEFNLHQTLEQSVLVYDTFEAMMIPLMQEIEREWPQVRIFSLPHIGQHGNRSFVELGVKGDVDQVRLAFRKLQDGLKVIGAEYELN